VAGECIEVLCFGRMMPDNPGYRGFDVIMSINRHDRIKKLFTFVTQKSNCHQTPVSRFHQFSGVLAFQCMTSASGQLQTFLILLYDSSKHGDLEMEWDAVGAIAELFGAFAVLITVAYLAMQIGQNTRALKTSYLNNRTFGLQQNIET